MRDERDESLIDERDESGLGRRRRRRGLGDESLRDERDESLMRELSLRVMMRESMVR